MEPQWLSDARKSASGRDYEEVVAGAKVLVARSGEMSAFQPEVAEAIAGTWSGHAFLHVMDDELKFRAWRTTSAEFDEALEWLLQRLADPDVQSPEFVRGIVDAAVSPKVTIAAMDQALREVIRDWPADARNSGMRITRTELCRYGTNDVGAEALLRSDGSDAWLSLVEILPRHLGYGYGLRGSHLARTLIAFEVFDACVTNYADSVASRFLREDLQTQLFEKDGYGRRDAVENYAMLIELLKRGIQPISRIVPEVLRLQVVEPRSLADEMLNDVKSYDVFISHMSLDKPFARGLGQALQARGHTVWLDEWIMRPGDVLSRQIADGIEASKHFVILLSKAALERDWVIYELDLALVRQVETRGATRFVIPVLLDDVDPPPTLRHLLYQRATTADDPTALAEVLFPS